MAYTRGYDPSGYRPTSFGGFSFFPPVIKWLLITNTGMLVLLYVLEPFAFHGIPIGGLNGILVHYLALEPLRGDFWPWQLFSYMFLHGGLAHLFFNMLALWMFGMELENVWGSRRFLIYYLVCGLAGGLSNLLIGPLIGQVGPTVGASGAIFGVLVAFGMMFPNRPVYIYFLLPVRAKYLVMFWIGFELIFGITGTPDGVAHFAHLGGAAAGFLYMAWQLNMIPGKEMWRQFRGEFQNPFASTSRTGQNVEIRDAKFYDIDTGKPLDRTDMASQEVIDSILDKISKGGYQSLTDDEKRLLNEASKHIH